MLLTPITILLQIGCFPFLIRYGVRYTEGKEFSLRQRNFLSLSLVIAPVVMLILVSGFSFDISAGEGEHLFYYIQWAELTILPIYLIASMSLNKAIFNNEYLATSFANYIMVATLAAIAAMYTYANPIFAIVPGITFLNYLAFLFIVNRMGRLQSLNPLFAFIWFSALIASLLAKYPLAKRFYEQLPPAEPPDTWICFVVSAAAQGHPWIVKSWINPSLGKPVNRQWYIFKRFEAVLAFHFPQIHRILRRIYNRLGPFIAKRIRYPWQADLVYLLLKPIEWVVFIVCQKWENY